MRCIAATAPASSSLKKAGVVVKYAIPGGIAASAHQETKWYFSMAIPLPSNQTTQTDGTKGWTHDG
jgi:hypothetical protein